MIIISKRGVKWII